MAVIEERLHSKYVTFNGMEIYYEVHGRGKPLLLLHGGITATQTMRGTINELAKCRLVIALHAQGHGNTIRRRLHLYVQECDSLAACHQAFERGRVRPARRSFSRSIIS
jgi:pimeloyl-ACP methyl ester carboxylesterase